MVPLKQAFFFFDIMRGEGVQGKFSRCESLWIFLQRACYHGEKLDEIRFDRADKTVLNYRTGCISGIWESLFETFFFVTNLISISKLSKLDCDAFYL